MRSSFAKAVTVVTGSLLVAVLLTGRSAAADSTTQEGCLTQWLFNGVWRVQATKVEPLMDGAQQVGWQVTEVWRDGTSQEASPSDSLLKDQVLELADGSSIAASTSNNGTMSMSGMSSHYFAPAAQFTYVQLFRAPGFNAAIKPKALAITFDGNRLPQFKARAQFTTRQYNFHIKLDCTASGTQTAQGGAYEIKATPGCTNQWMSNGLWRMRATAIGPNNDVGGTQNGWMITENWTSLAGKPIAAGDTFITDQQLVLENGDTIASSSGVISTGSFGELVQHMFAPGGSFTYQQRFIQIPFDVANKPVKLIVTFDAAKEKLVTYRPQYKVNPPNFRISFTCTK